MVGEFLQNAKKIFFFAIQIEKTEINFAKRMVRKAFFTF